MNSKIIFLIISLSLSCNSFPKEADSRRNFQPEPENVRPNERPILPNTRTRRVYSRDELLALRERMHRNGSLSQSRITPEVQEALDSATIRPNS